MRDMLLVIDFDHIAARTVARKLRSERICCKILPSDATADQILAQGALGVIFACASDQTPDLSPWLTLPVPVLALSGGCLSLCQALGGRLADVIDTNALCAIDVDDCPLLSGIEQNSRLLSVLREMSLPDDAQVLATTRGIPVAFSDAKGKCFGVVIDIETHDPEGSALLCNFALNLCGCTAWWDEGAFVLRAIQEIKRMTGDGEALCAMTGGLNSGVSAVLAKQALGDKLHCIFIETGLLRKDEGDTFLAYYRDKLGLSIDRIDASDRFIEALSGVTDETEKKKIVGALLSDILLQEQEKIPGLTVRIKGTSCTDVLTGNLSSSGTLPLVEPIRDLFKDEIRQIGEYLGMDDCIINRQPFPGSGLALRIKGAVTRERLQTLREADAIFTNTMAASNQCKRLWQHYAILCPETALGDVICLRAIHATDGIVSHVARLPYDILESVTAEILAQTSVSRVVYDLTPSTHQSSLE